MSRRHFLLSASLATTALGLKPLTGMGAPGRGSPARAVALVKLSLWSDRPANVWMTEAYPIPADANQAKPTGEQPAAPGAGAAIPRETRDIAGWQVHISKKLLEAEPDATARALTGPKKMLDEVVRVVPAPVVTELRKVPLYCAPGYKAGRSGAEFHPDAGWLRDNGRDPAMARSVEFSGVHDFEAEMRRMPNFALHELAHAMTNPMEHFAETTEACFTRNDFFPFTREELKRHDPAMFALLERPWGVPDVK